ncbi:MAG: Holliday junction ATP-dependent DNA helicase RuvA [Acidobacteriota bacterium]|nr:Holliday junction ATP-dependent DNA helicase RuvA [Acidobacteriota bacterium]MDE2710630.1 Holliday junction ATP-dependent DNA helicase RuvA [Acidobacteriota bacterium]MXW71815.1 Holliday junction branch migration protein RuvA [Acidobacteriota bacterium]MXX86391.1 Holliday junction branch migration protein RuvA [Acidobacteriota bacterium]MYE43731.1 Holliday junction branch migration protein RuvA [Acidobacteriota bacterium]
MIERLAGRLVEAREGDVLIDVGGIGFRLQVSTGTASRLPASGEEVRLTVRMLLHREETVQLYGFGSGEEARLFDQLRGVNGVGPSVALNLLSLSVPRLRQAIRDKEVKFLQGAPGVGAKLARRLITELAEALPDDESDAPPPAPRDPVHEQLVTAFANLQFTDRRRVEEVVQSVRAEKPDAELQELFKAALSRLSSRSA